MSRGGHEELVELIRSIIDDWEEEKGEFLKFEFCFSAAIYDKGVFLNDPASLDILDTFKALGLRPEPYDSYEHAFNHNRDYWFVTCDKCVQAAGFVLPVSDDIEALARMVEYEHSGQVQFIVTKLDQSR